MYRGCRVVFYLVVIGALAGCKKPFNPPAIVAPSSYLVVEGVINNGPDSTFIKLSNTVNLSNKITFNPVLHAVLTVESDNSAIYPLAETAKGYYGCAGLKLDNTRKYRLRIKIGDGKEYLSDFVQVIDSPSIDSVSYTVQNNGIQFYVNTHDAKNSTHYYRWDYQETWIIHSTYYSFYRSTGDTVIERNLPSEQVYQCWRSDSSSTIVLASSSSLAKDEISNAPLTFVPSTSEKLSSTYSIIADEAAPSNNAYSIIVKQYALTGDAYNFWTNLKKNTEQLGSIFDAQPSQIKGNIHSTANPSEPVIGYISAGIVTSRRIFISNDQINAHWPPQPPDTSSCQIDSLYLSYNGPGAAVAVNQEDEYFNYNKGTHFYQSLIPLASIYNPKNGKLIGHTGSYPQCVDCTLRGTNTEPGFWR